MDFAFAEARSLIYFAIAKNALQAFDIWTSPQLKCILKDFQTNFA